MRNITLSNTQRALWMVLITSLAVPFFAGIIDLGLMLLSPATDFLLPSRGGEGLGKAGIDAFVWSAFPATVSALGLTPFVLQNGTYGWLEAAVAGVLGFMAAAIIFPLDASAGVPFLAFVAGLLFIGMRALLMTIGILKH
ncbi:hypothetical protein SAMN04488557_0857 [Hyphomicrobium facile]|uniref:Uncharacterized protein n=1 Tax=Hyphomicrobium facile TaxID=51670 RepID=A0A1I7MZJ9_9HYPH|nr:hypothetical protein SAMN04488557_0857 [Hyphomicrobium facile]